MNKEDAASLTVSTDVTLLMAVIDAKEGRDIMTADIPNAFVQTEVGTAKDGEKNCNECPWTTHGYSRRA